MASEDLLQHAERTLEEEKFSEWALEEADLELGMAMDPKSYAAKAFKERGRIPQLRRRQLGRGQPPL